MKQRKTSLDLLGWDGASDEESTRLRETPEASQTAANENSDSDCPTAIPGYRGIKINPSDISKLTYNSTVAQYNNWLADLKTSFDENPIKFPTNRHKIILASIILND